MKKKDLMLLGIMLTLAAALYLVSQLSLRREESDVVVTIDGKETLRRPLSQDGVYELRQEDGALNVLVVEDGAAFMREANCRDGLCIRQGRMKNGAKTIVCLPHGLAVRIEGSAAQADHGEPDLIVH